jgi:ABC-type phosphate transport system auxiliary subunit
MTTSHPKFDPAIHRKTDDPYDPCKQLWRSPEQLETGRLERELQARLDAAQQLRREQLAARRERAAETAPQRAELNRRRAELIAALSEAKAFVTRLGAELSAVHAALSELKR